MESHNDFNMGDTHPSGSSTAAEDQDTIITGIDSLNITTESSRPRNYQPPSITCTPPSPIIKPDASIVEVLFFQPTYIAGLGLEPEDYDLTSILQSPPRYEDLYPRNINDRSRYISPYGRVQYSPNLTRSRVQAQTPTPTCAWRISRPSSHPIRSQMTREDLLEPFNSTTDHRLPRTPRLIPLCQVRRRVLDFGLPRNRRQNNRADNHESNIPLHQKLQDDVPRYPRRNRTSVWNSNRERNDRERTNMTSSNGSGDSDSPLVIPDGDVMETSLDTGMEGGTSASSAGNMEIESEAMVERLEAFTFGA